MCIQCVFQQYHEAPDDAKHFYYLFIYVVIYLFIDLPIYLFLPHLMLFTTWPVFIHKTDSSWIDLYWLDYVLTILKDKPMKP